jgi:hypothetical protein
MLIERVAGELDAGGEVLFGGADSLLRKAEAREEADRAAPQGTLLGGFRFLPQLRCL